MTTDRGADPADPTGSVALAAQFTHQLRVLAGLRAARPAYEFWWEPRGDARPVLVARRLATCINIVPCLRSIYRWKGKVCEDSEYLLIIKTRRALFAAVSEAIREIHSYELPEVLEFPVATAEANFHRWVVEMATGVVEAEAELESEPSFD